MEGGRPPAAHDDVVRVALVLSPGERHGRLSVPRTRAFRASVRRPRPPRIPPPLPSLPLAPLLRVRVP